MSETQDPAKKAQETAELLRRFADGILMSQAGQSPDQNQLAALCQNLQDMQARLTQPLVSNIQEEAKPEGQKGSGSTSRNDGTAKTTGKASTQGSPSGFGLGKGGQNIQGTPPTQQGQGTPEKE